MKEEDFTRILELEEEYVQKTCEDIIRVKPDVVFTEKGVSDLAQHYLVKVILLSLILSWHLKIIKKKIKGWYHCYPSREEIGQQPHRPCLWSYNC